eukprot:scaffold7117_cov390-Prasinococcus_capsulatus_cf.AAC.2
MPLRRCQSRRRSLPRLPARCPCPTAPSSPSAAGPSPACAPHAERCARAASAWEAAASTRPPACGFGVWPMGRPIASCAAASHQQQHHR